jgi:transposase
MSGKSQYKILTEILNIPGVKVTNYSQHSGIGIILRLESESQEAICPNCGTLSRKIHQNHRHLVKDFPMLGQPTYLEVNRRQFKCEKCSKPFSESLSYVKKKRKYTNRLSKSIIEQVLSSNIKSVAKKNDVSEEEIQTMLKDAAKELINEKPKSIKRLGIDEIALVKGQKNYCVVLVNLDTGELITIIEGRTKAKIKEVLETWGEEVLSQIEEVSMDLCKTYKSVVRELMPKAQIVADRFHVIKQINEELNQQRIKEVREAKKIENEESREKVLEGLKKSKYVLLKNAKDLNEAQKNKLQQVREVSPILAKMHQLKERLIRIFEKGINWLLALFLIGKWLISAQKYFPESLKTIKRWIDEIIAYFDNRTTNGMVEGINNKLKLIKRNAYGFRNFNNFKFRSLLTWEFNC